MVSKSKKWQISFWQVFLILQLGFLGAGIAIGLENNGVSYRIASNIALFDVFVLIWFVYSFYISHIGCVIKETQIHEARQWKTLLYAALDKNKINCNWNSNLIPREDSIFKQESETFWKEMLEAGLMEASTFNKILHMKTASDEYLEREQKRSIKFIKR